MDSWYCHQKVPEKIPARPITLYTHELSVCSNITGRHQMAVLLGEWFSALSLLSFVACVFSLSPSLSVSFGKGFGWYLFCAPRVGPASSVVSLGASLLPSINHGIYNESVRPKTPRVLANSYASRCLLRTLRLGTHCDTCLIIITVLLPAFICRSYARGSVTNLVPTWRTDHLCSTSVLM